MAEADLSKIVNIILENPKLVEEIRNTVAKSEVEDKTSEPRDIIASEEETAHNESEAQASVPVFEENTYKDSRSKRRNDLLRAMRPYVSEERGKAIESMITIADILFAIKEK